MTYLPEQEEVLRYLRERGTDAAPEALLSEARAAFDKFGAAFAAVPAPVRLVEPFPGRWSPQQILDHVVECHRCAPGQLLRLQRGEPGDQRIRAFVQSAAPYAHPWRALLREANAIHQGVLEAASALAAGPMPAVGAPVELVAVRHDPAQGRDIEWLEYLDWKAYLRALASHAHQHTRQLARTLEQIG